VITVVGMHRSGTSFLVGSLQQRGLFLGEHSTWNRYNRRGNRENRAVRDLNEKVLEDSGGSWDGPPPRIEWKPEHLSVARAILAEYADQPVWGFKDPRVLLTFSGWEQLVPDIEPVGIFRHPGRVARSLKGRDEMPRDRALNLWCLYNRRLIELHGRKRFPILSFDEEATTLEAKLERVADLLRLEGGSVGEPFFSEELRQAPADEDPLPAEVQEIYDELHALSL
jgi:hypothetical protein